jgi:hypothetical protein
MKRCKGPCQELLPPEAFYEKSGSRDGRESKCRDCKCQGVSTNRKKNAAHYKAYDKVRNQNLDRREAVQRYQQTEKGKEGKARSAMKYENKHPERIKAQKMANLAMAQGTIQKPIACEKCGRKTFILQAHHHDYSKHLDVTFLCVGCHHNADNARRGMES